MIFYFNKNIIEAYVKVYIFCNLNLNYNPIINVIVTCACAVKVGRHHPD